MAHARHRAASHDRLRKQLTVMRSRLTRLHTIAYRAQTAADHWHSEAAKARAHARKLQRDLDAARHELDELTADLPPEPAAPATASRPCVQCQGSGGR